MGDNHKTDKTGHTKLRAARLTIGLLSGVGGSSFYNDLWAGFVSAASELDVNLICYVGGFVNALDKFNMQSHILYNLVTGERVDGLIISGTIGNYVTADDFKSFINRYRPLPMVGVTQTPSLPCVVVDNEKGMRDIVTHFIEVHGYRRIAFICGPENSKNAVLRYRAYADVLAEHDVPLDPDLVAPGTFVYEAGIDAIRLLLDERKVGFDAVVAASDWMAFGALKALEERGIRVPDDVALGGFDDTREAAASHPSLTTVRQPVHQLGRTSIEALLKLLAGEQVPEQTMLPTKLVVRQSCGCSEPVVAHAAVGPLERKREPLGEAIVAQREAILSEMVQAMGVSVSLLSEWAGRLLDAFVEEMVSGSAPQGSFLSVLDDVLRQAIAMGGQVDDWQEALSVMRRHLLPYLTDVATLSRAEDLFSQGRVVVGKVAQWNWARREVEETRLAEVQSELGGDLVAAVEMERVFDAIGYRLPQLGFATFYLSLYDGQEHLAEWSRLMLAYDSGKRVEMDAAGRRFLTRQLVPEELLSRERRYTWVVESLNFRENQFGCLILEAGSHAGDIYGALARQISGALQDSLLVQQLENRRVQLMTAAEVSRAASSILEPDELIQQAVNLVRERFGLYYAGLFLVDDSGKWAVLRAGTGEAGQRMLEQGHKLEIGGTSMVGWCMANKQARIALDVGEEAVRFANPLLPETRSELALPLMSRGEAIGALTIQSTQEAAFSEEDIAVLQTMADQLANAIANARLFERTQSILQEIETTQRRYLRQAWKDYTSTEETPQGYLRSGDGEGPTTEAWLPAMTTALQQGDTVVGRDEQDGATLAIPLTVSDEVIGAVGFSGSGGWSEEDIAAVEAIIEQVALALENQRLFDEAQQSTFLLSKRVEELDCLNDIGRKIEETPPVPEFSRWITERIPSAMRYPDVCLAAIELEGQVYGSREAVSLPCQMVQALRIGGQVVGRVYISYTEEHDFIDEESALLGDIVRRVSDYIESRRLFLQIQTRAERERAIREITDQMQRATDMETLMRITAEELNRALGGSRTYVRLGTEASLRSPGGNGLMDEGDD